MFHLLTIRFNLEVVHIASIQYSYMGVYICSCSALQRGNVSIIYVPSLPSQILGLWLVATASEVNLLACLCLLRAAVRQSDRDSREGSRAEPRWETNLRGRDVAHTYHTLSLCRRSLLFSLFCLYYNTSRTFLSPTSLDTHVLYVYVHMCGITGLVAMLAWLGT